MADTYLLNCSALWATSLLGKARPHAQLALRDSTILLQERAPAYRARQVSVNATLRDSALS